MITVENLSFLYRKSKRAVLQVIRKPAPFCMTSPCHLKRGGFTDYLAKMVQANLHYSI